LGERRVGRDHRERRAFLHAALRAWRERACRQRRGKTATAVFPVALERRRPEPWPATDDDATGAIDSRERADRVSAVGDGRGGAAPALEIDRGRAEPGADAAQGKIVRCRHCCPVAEIAIGWKAAPVLVAAV